MRLLIAALLFAAAAASSGCAPNDLSVFVEEASFMDERCSATGDTKLASGSLDLGPAQTLNVLPRYFGLFRLRSELEPNVIQTGDDVLSGNSRNEFVATSVSLTYSLASGAGVPPTAVEPTYFVVLPGTDDGSVLFNMINTAAATAIRGLVTVGNSDTLLVNFRFEGSVRSGSNTPIKMHTPEVQFPIFLYHTSATFPPCMSPGVSVIKGPCGNAQETYSLGCSQ
jgi:hypothetical protein